MAITKAKKSEQLSELTSLFKEAKSVILADYSGLNVNQTNDLRKKLADTSATVTVSKNSLIEKALQESKVDGEDVLKGQTAVIVAKNDPLSPIKALFEFIKEFNLPIVTLGFMDGKKLFAADIKELATIPSKEVLLGKVARSLNTPITKLVWSFSGIEKKLVYAIAEIAKKKT